MLLILAVEDTARLLLRGQQNRHTAATNMNRESSRSHSVFTCVVESKTTDEAGLITMLSARVNLVDLAGTSLFGICYLDKHNAAVGPHMSPSKNAVGSLSLSLAVLTQHKGHADQNITHE